MAFSDDDIRAIVQTGQYSKEAEDWITAALIERRNRIGRTFFAGVLPLDRFRVSANGLEFDDLAVTYGFSTPRAYTIEWYGFDNARNAILDQSGTGPAVPSSVQALATGAYVAARVSAGNADMRVEVFLRKGANGFEVVGLERTWPGKVISIPPPPPRADRRVFADLSVAQRGLFDTFAKVYNGSRGTQFSSEEVFDRLTISGADHLLWHHARVDEHAAHRHAGNLAGIGDRSRSSQSSGSRDSTRDAAATSNSGSSSS